ncbi:MAG: hypothetical protein IPH48_18310 [bacterium]|nr:hypothetical protein [bacterium]
MNRWTLSVLLSALLWAPAALAQLTVVTDQATYNVGDVVSFTIHNAGPGVATFVSDPPFSIWHVESGDCVDGCMGLPVVWTLPVGGTISGQRDTGTGPDLAGHYEIALAGSSSDPGSILSAEYEVTAAVAASTETWGAVKGLFR